MTSLRLLAAQINTTVGAIEANRDRVCEVLASIRPDEVDVVAFPELTITGYPPEDLLLKPSFVADNLLALREIAEVTAGVPCIVGFVDFDGDRLYNAAAVCRNGQVEVTYRKRLLPNYSVFDEARYFTPGVGPPCVFQVGDVVVGLTICEDAWSADGPIATTAAAGAQAIVNINASPFHRGKVRVREQMLMDRAIESGVPLAYVNLVGGQDELVFDGGSASVDASGRVTSRGAQFREAMVLLRIHLDAEPNEEQAELAEPLDPVAEVYEALVLGTADYVRKNGFREVVLGLSGGVDSALTAAVAVDALGADCVHVVLMPSRYSSDHSVSDAEALAGNLNVDHRLIEIEPAHASFLDLLAPSFEGTVEGVAEENLQPRIRGTLLMALSNKFGWMVLTTGNKSEMAVGYATLYGDMAGGYAVIKDVPKFLVYELCRYRNDLAGTDLIPDSILEKPPSAELRPDQLDTDSLPEYDLLDAVLEAYIDGDRTAADLIGLGYDEGLVRRITRLVDINEYKRRQSPPGPRITTKAFGKDRRLPITNGYGLPPQ